MDKLASYKQVYEVGSTFLSVDFDENDGDLGQIQSFITELDSAKESSNFILMEEYVSRITTYAHNPRSHIYDLILNEAFNFIELFAYREKISNIVLLQLILVLTSSPDDQISLTLCKQGLINEICVFIRDPRLGNYVTAIYANVCVSTSEIRDQIFDFYVGQNKRIDVEHKGYPRLLSNLAHFPLEPPRSYQLLVELINLLALTNNERTKFGIWGIHRLFSQNSQIIDRIVIEPIINKALDLVMSEDQAVVKGSLNILKDVVCSEVMLPDIDFKRIYEHVKSFQDATFTSFLTSYLSFLPFHDASVECIDVLADLMQNATFTSKTDIISQLYVFISRTSANFYENIVESRLFEIFQTGVALESPPIIESIIKSLTYLFQMSLKNSRFEHFMLKMSEFSLIEDLIRSQVQTENLDIFIRNIESVSL